MEHFPTKNNVPVLEMQGVAVGALRDPTTIIAEQVDWTVSAGDYWAVAGLQGSGKSDFLAMTGGLMAPLAGHYRLFGHPMPIFEDARLPERLRLGLVFDGGQLFNELTVQDNVALPLRYHRNLTATEVEAEVRIILGALELEPWAGAAPGTIGHNWRKRAGLARALALKPEVLLVDNALTGLDLRHAQWWLDFLDGLSEGRALPGSRPVTLVVTTADLRPWKGRARQFAVLRDKRLTVLGTREKLEGANDELLHEFLPNETRGQSGKRGA